MPADVVFYVAGYLGFVESFPRDTHYKLDSTGRQLILNCTPSHTVDFGTDESIEWLRFPMLPPTSAYLDNDEHTVLAKDLMLKDSSTTKYELHGNFDLLIRNPGFDDAGSYGCYTFLSTGQIEERGDAQVLITGKKRSAVDDG